MKAIVAGKVGIAHLSFEEVDAPGPATSEALVRVRAVSLNPGEVRMTRSPRPNWRPGWDLAGVVEAEAADGSGPPVGSRVVGIVKSGAWAEQAAVPTNQLAVLPDAVTFAQAATLPVAGLTALHALWKGGFLLGRNVLITGATGGVGDYAIQLAKLTGATVTAQVRRAEQEFTVRESGADNVIVSDGAADAKPYGPFALIIDSVGGQVLGDALGLVEEGTRIVSLGTTAGNLVTFDAAKFYGVGMASLYGMILFDEFRAVETADQGLARLARFVADGKLIPYIGVEDSWENADTLTQQLLDRRYQGKAVLHVGE